MNFSFLSPYFLIGLGAIVLPIIAHLITKKTGISKRFAAINFLLVSRGKSSTISRFKDLVLLLIRSLILVLLVLAFAKPAVFSFSILDSQHIKSVAIVIDNSYSMGYDNNFNKAIRVAKQQIESLVDGSFGMVFPLVEFNPSSPSFSQDKNKMKHILNELTLSYTYVDNERRIEEIFGYLQEAPNEKKEVIFITDFQKNGWVSDKFSRGWFVPIDITKGADLKNIAITETQIKEVEESVIVDVEVSNFSKIPNNAKLGTLTIGRNKLNGLFDLKPDSKQTKEFNYQKNQLNQPEIIGNFEISPDDLTVDNHRYFVYSRDSELKVLVVDGDPRELSRLSETYYISRALETLSDLLGLSLSISDNDSFLRENLEKYKLIFLANVGDITPEKSLEIERHVNSGGVIVIFLGNRIKSNIYNALFDKILPGHLSSILEGEFSLKTSNSDQVFAKNNEQFNKVIVNKLYNTVPNEHSDTLLEASNGESFLLRREYGSGTIFLFTSSADLNWNKFPISPVFLHTIKTIFELSTAKKSANRNLIVGDKATIDFGNDFFAATVTTPSGEKFIVESASLIFENTQIPGTYNVEFENGLLYRFAVNIDTKESNLEKIHLGTPNRKDKPSSNYAKVFQEIWRYFLLAAIILFISESILRGLP